MSNDDLQSLSGVGPATAEKLRDAGLDSFQAIAVAQPSELSNQGGVGEGSAPDIIEAAQDAADVGGFETGSAVLDRRRQMVPLKFNIPDADDLYGGGLESQSMHEFYGEFGSGKSQVAHQLSVNVQLPEPYGLGKRAVYIDTEDTFRPERISGMVHGLDEEILEAVLARDMPDSGYTVSDIKNSAVTSDGYTKVGTPADELAQIFAERIDVAKAFNTNHQILVGEKAQDVMKEHEGTDWEVGLLVVDSLTAHFRAEFVGRGELASRQQKLNQHLSDLSRLTDLYNLVTVITNQVQSNPDSYFGDPTKPIGGNILGHKSTLRTYIKKSKGDKRIFSLNDAPATSDGEAVIRVKTTGLKAE